MRISDLATAPRPVCLSPDVSYPEYAEIPAVRSGVVKDSLVEDVGRQFIVSPAHIKRSYEGQLAKDSDSLDFGKALHCLMFEPDKFESEFCACELRRDMRTKAYQDFVEANAGKTVLKAHGDRSYQWCLDAAVAFCQVPEIKPFTECGIAEVTGQGVISDVPVKARYDWISQSRDCLVDLKTSMAIGPMDFWRSFKRYGYGIQLALYREIYRQISSIVLECFIIAIENHPPFSAVVYEVPGDLLDRDMALVRTVCDKVAECLEKDEWPSFSYGQVLPLLVPEWEMESVDVLDWSE